MEHLLNTSVNMKKLLTLALALSSLAALAQQSGNVGIGTKTPDPSAILDLSSTTKGLLLPRMTQAQRNAIKNPVAGLIVYQTDQGIGTYTYDGTTWQPSNARIGSALVAGPWDKQGNAIDGTDFLGSTNDFDVVFKRNGIQGGRIGSTSTFFGVNSGLANTATFNVGIGFQALRDNTTGSSNVAVGTNTLALNIGGSFNTAFGYAALQNNKSDGNLALGSNALFSNSGTPGSGTGAYNVALGDNSLYNNTLGSRNVAIGGAALNSLIGSTASTSFNLAIGYGSLQQLATGTGNTAVGYSAGLNKTSGSGNVYIGNNAGSVASSTAESDALYISNSSSVNPLIKGSFHATAPWVKFNVKPTPGSPTPTTTGYLAIGDFDTAPGGAGAGGLGLPASFSGGAYRLYVQDGIMTEKLKVALRNSADWADYVFAPEYKLAPLEDVETFIKVNKHLPNVPSADEMAANGIDVTKTSAKLMEKIEELTLYIIEMDKEIKALKAAQNQKNKI